MFILGADTGVTKSDLAIWRDHLGAHAPTRFVVLNKIDALADPLATPKQVEAQIAQQQRETARTLGVPRERVFPLSARAGARGARRGDDAGAATSRLPALEAALGAQLLPQRRAGARAGRRWTARSRSSATSRAASATSAASSPSRCSSCAACAARAAPRCA